MTGEPNDLAEILKRNELVPTRSYCTSKGDQVLPHFVEVLGGTTQDGVDYIHGTIIDGRSGHFRADNGSEAFGGPAKEISDSFEEIDGRSFKRVKEECGRTALKKADGKRYTGKAHDTIKRDPNTVLEDKGVVYHVTDDNEEGWYLDEQICGRMKNGMNHKSTLVKAGNEKTGYKVFLIAENKKGEKRVVDIKTGEIKYGDEENCTEIELLPVGTEICARKTYGKTQEVRSENGDVIYYVLRARTGEFIEDSGGHFARTYDDDGSLTIVDRRSNGGSCRTRFGTEKPARREGEGGPEGNGIFDIYNKHLIELFVDNPDVSEEGLLVTFKDKDGKDPFRGPHFKLGKTKDDKPVMVTAEGLTGILFENKSKAIYYIGSNGNEMFGGQHFDQLDMIENWGYDSEGKMTESPATMIHFVELSGKHVVIDHKEREFFPKSADSDKTEGHTKIEDFWVLSYNKGGEGRNVLIAEAKDPVGLGKSLLSWITGKGWTPSTYYLQDGTNFSSMDSLKQSLGAPSDAQPVYARDFNDPNAENMKATKDRARDTGRYQVAAAQGVSPEILAMVKQTEEAAGVSHTGVTEIPSEAPAEAQQAETAPEEPPKSDESSEDGDGTNGNWLLDGDGNPTEGQES